MSNFNLPQQQDPSYNEPNRKIENVRAGQKLVIWAIVLIVLAYVLAFLSGRVPILGLGVLVLVLTSWIMSIVGIIQLSRGMGYHILMSILFCILVFLPLVGLITLAILNDKATKQLKANGYSVGFMGANAKA